MKSFRKEIPLYCDARRKIVCITDEVKAALKESGIREGLLLCNPMHVTASVFINDREQGLYDDYEVWLEGLAPELPYSRYKHNDCEVERNADSHLKRQIMGREAVVAVTDGNLDFGTWEDLFFYDFDGNRPRTILVKIIGE